MPLVRCSPGSTNHLHFTALYVPRALQWMASTRQESLYCWTEVDRQRHTGGVESGR